MATFYLFVTAKNIDTASEDILEKLARRYQNNNVWLDQECGASEQPALFTKFYGFFQTNEGKRVWEEHNDKLRLNYLNNFFKMELPFVRFDNNLALNRTGFDKDLLKQISFSHTPADIKKYSKNQAGWVYHYLSSDTYLNLPMPATLAYLDLLNASAPIQEIHHMYQTENGKQIWKKEGSLRRLMHLAKFFENDLPYFPCDKEDLKKMNIPKTLGKIQGFTKNQSIWLLHHISSCEVPLDDDIAQACDNLFNTHGILVPAKLEVPVEHFNNLPDADFSRDPQTVAPLTVEKIETVPFLDAGFSRDPQIIKQYDQDRARQVHALLSTEENLNLPVEAMQAYADIFYKYELPPILDSAKQPKIVPRTLEVPQNYKELTEVQTNWYYVLMGKNINWKALSLVEQYDLNKSFLKHLDESIYLIPTTKEDIINASSKIVKELVITYKGSPENLEDCDESMQSALFTKFHEFFQDEINNWKELSLEQQYDLNKSFLRHLDKSFYLVPRTEEDISNASSKIVKELVITYKDRPEKLAEECDESMQSALFTKFHEFFQTDKGKKLWEKHDDKLRLNYLNKFFEMGLPFVRFDNDILGERQNFDKDLLERISISQNPDEIRNYSKNQADWLLHYLIRDQALNLSLVDEGIAQACSNLFTRHGILAPAKPVVPVEPPIGNITDFSIDPQIIMGYSKDQAKVAHALFLRSKEELGLSKEANQAYAELFYKYELLPPVVEGKSRIVPTTLEAPKDYSKLTIAQTSWYKIWMESNGTVLSTLSLEDQLHLYECFFIHGFQTLHICVTAKNITNILPKIIEKLAIRYAFGDGWLAQECPASEQLALFTKFHEFFQTDHGKRVWANFKDEWRLLYLNYFFGMDFPFVPFDDLLGAKRKDFDKGLFRKIPFSLDPTEINNYSQNQAGWLLHILSSDQTFDLSPEVSAAYIKLFQTLFSVDKIYTLFQSENGKDMWKKEDKRRMDHLITFFKHNLPFFPSKDISQASVDLFYQKMESPLVQIEGDEKLFENFELTAPKDYENLTEHQIHWYQLYFSTNSIQRWRLFPLELQDILNQKFVMLGATTFDLVPSSLNEIINIPLSIIEKLEEKYGNADTLKECDESLQQSLNMRFYEFYITEPGSKKWKSRPSESRLFHLNLFFKSRLPFHSSFSFSEDLIKMDIPKSSATIQAFLKNQSGWLYNHILSLNDIIAEDISQACVDLFYKYDYSPFPKIEGKERILSENFKLPIISINPDSLKKLTGHRALWYRLYIGNNTQRWESFPISMQHALNQQFMLLTLNPFDLNFPDSKDIENASESLIEELIKKYGDFDTFPHDSDEKLKKILTFRFHHFYEVSVDINIWKNKNPKTRVFFLNLFFKYDYKYIKHLSYPEDLKEMDIPKIPANIKGFSQNQAVWLHQHILSSKQKITKHLAQACVDLFYRNIKHSFPEIEDLETIYGECDTFPHKCDESKEKLLINQFYEFYKSDAGKNRWNEIDKEIRILYVNLFFKYDLGYFAFFGSLDEELKMMGIPKTPDSIKKFTLNQIVWLYKHLGSSNVIIAKDISQACVDHFYAKDFAPFEPIDNSERISAENFELPILENLTKLTTAQIGWYKIYLNTNEERWGKYSLQMQGNLKKKFEETDKKGT